MIRKFFAGWYDRLQACFAILTEKAGRQGFVESVTMVTHGPIVDWLVEYYLLPIVSLEGRPNVKYPFNDSKYMILLSPPERRISLEVVLGNSGKIYMIGLKEDSPIVIQDDLRGAMLIGFVGLKRLLPDILDELKRIQKSALEENRSTIEVAIEALESLSRHTQESMPDQERYWE